MVSPVEEITVEGGWQEFVEMHNLDRGQSLQQYMYRGQSNGIVNGKFERWGIISSFNRRYQSTGGYTFGTYLSQQLNAEFFKKRFGGYEYNGMEHVLSLDKRNKCHYFQHYGVPTCFIDFTFDPLVALYFAISGIEGRSGKTFDGDGNCIVFPSDYYMSIFQIDYQNLKKYLNLTDLSDLDFESDIMEDTKISQFPSPGGCSASLALDINPAAKINSNFNLKAQQGCFIFYDNNYTNNWSIEKFVTEFCKVRNIVVEQPLIKIFNIRYNSIFAKMTLDSTRDMSLFSFLKRNKIYGCYLFDDIQGVKTDLNFFHEE
jgi:FRG domain